MLLDSLACSTKPKEVKEKEEEENKRKDEHKKSIYLYCLQKPWKKGGGYIGVTLNISLFLLLT